MKKTVRQDYYYPNIEKSLIRVVELCVASVFKGGDKFYKGKKDFIVKAIQNQIVFEANKNKELAIKIEQQTSAGKGGNSTIVHK